MNITLHKEIPRPAKVTSLVPFVVLDNIIRRYLSEHTIEQEDYYIDYNPWFCFIYVDGGIRIDVEL
jgi:hypothetical protein